MAFIVTLYNFHSISKVIGINSVEPCHYGDMGHYLRIGNFSPSQIVSKDGQFFLFASSNGLHMLYLTGRSKRVKRDAVHLDAKLI